MKSQEVKSRLIAWALYDFASGPFSSIILTFVFATYFVEKVAANRTEGAAVWGIAMGVSGLAVAIAGPFFGTLADQGGTRKRWLAAFTLLCMACTTLLWFIFPDQRYTLPALILAATGAAAIEFAYIFYNAMLPELAGPQNVGRWSGWGWGAGYVGGVITLVISLLLFIGPNALFSTLDRTTGQEVRATFLLTAAWYALFAIPLFIIVPSPVSAPAENTKNLFRASFKQLVSTFKQLRSFSNIFRFLIARMIFNDALLTLFAFGGVYAAAVFDMSEQKILIFGILLNVTAGIGAVSFAWLDDHLGGRTIIILALIGLIVTGSVALLAQHEWLFWAAGLVLGLFVGPAQASSRSYMARVTPEHMRNEMFGFFALSAKVTAFFGPMLLGWLTLWMGSMRVGMSAIIFLLIVGLILMLQVEPDKNP